MTTRNCPSCARAHDVSGLATGHQVSCACGARFTVGQDTARADEDAGATMISPSRAAAGASPVGTEPGLEGTYVSTTVTLPGYELERVLGRGGMGEVWLARQVSLGRKVAVKVLPPRLAKDPEFVTRFDKEATALAALSHPNIIQIIDRGVAGEHYYFVMEYVEGRSLRDVMRELVPPEALRLALQVARAIECAHDKGIIHRDLKPENILLDGRGHVKVADFGLAGFRSGSDSRLQLTGTSVAMGTLNYMAPEQRRDAKNVDGRADLFSFGVVLYEMLTGELPVGRFKLPSERVPGLDSRVDEVVGRLLENEPEARYARATEVCQALEALVTNNSRPSMSLVGAQPQAQARVGGALGRLKSGWRKVRAGLTVVGALVVLSFVLRMLLGPVGVQVSEDKKVVLSKGGLPRLVPADKAWPANTEGDLLVSSTTEALADGRVRLGVDFLAGGEEELNAHAGTWKLVDGQLQVMQGGNDASGSEGQLIPRAYLAHRYFSSDDFSAEVSMNVHRFGRDYPEEEPDAQHYAELAFRVTGLQVSVYAIPDTGMRLSWRYTTADGEEVVGNSAQEVDELVRDEAPVPSGAFRVKLQMKKRKNGVDVEAFLNGDSEPFARKYLEGFQGRVAKVALGCRNLICTFDDLTVRGIPSKKQARPKMAETPQE
ncbi:MAG TPA: serine/threonine-protein kinase [Archangium sp.]|jgi:serine/threonine-protein kinase|uniref:serine/threonine-protein kinase n=1 Tax=Archangium sp. TaxID=1872627 RepID=UPI002ED90800